LLKKFVTLKLRIFPPLQGFSYLKRREGVTLGLPKRIFIGLFKGNQPYFFGTSKLGRGIFSQFGGKEVFTTPGF